MAVVEIADVDELQAVSVDLSADYMLVNDIDASATTGWNDGKGFEPLGPEWSNSFYGRLYGRDYEITGLYINRPTERRVGLFGWCHGFVGDLYLVDVDITAEGYVGAFMGGADSGTLRIVNCHVSGTVTATETSENTMPSNGRFAGGFFGQRGGGEIKRCSANVDVIADGANIGGFAGRESSGLLENCYATGSVTLTKDLYYAYVGGFIGSADSGCNKCYSTTEVNVTAGTHDTWVGGFVGSQYYATTVANSFWDKQTSGQDEDGSGGDATGKTTAQMQDISTYNDLATDGLDTVWDIAEELEWDEEIWSINDGADYPKLKLPSSQVPDVIGSTETSAATTLDNNNLLVGDKIREWKQDIPESEVFDQDPLGGTWAVAGFEVDLWISLGSTGVYVNMNGEPVMCQVYVRDAGEAVLGKVNVK